MRIPIHLALASAVSGGGGGVSAGLPQPPPFTVLNFYSALAFFLFETRTNAGGGAADSGDRGAARAQHGRSTGTARAQHRVLVAARAKRNPPRNAMVTGVQGCDAHRKA